MVDVLSAERRGRITGSRIAGVLGLSPYRNRAGVMREMVREHHWAEEEFIGNVATEWGKDHEEEALTEYELATGKELTKAGEWQETVIDVERRLAVTPDGVEMGLRGNEPCVVGAVEIKCPYRALYTTWQERPDYQQQLHLIAELLGLERVDFGVWRPSGINITTMPHDESWWPSVKDRVEKFLEDFERIIASEEASAPFLVGREGERTDEEWATAAAIYLDLSAEADRVQSQLDLTKAELQGLAGKESAKGGGLQVIYRKPSTQGNVSWKDVAQHLAAQAKLTEAELKALGDQYRGVPRAGGYAYKLYDED